MKAHRGTTLAMILLVSACRIERTPDEYIDHTTSEQEAEELGSAGEVRDRLLAMGQALGRGSAEDALTALAPASDAFVIGPQAGLEVVGPEQIGAVLASLAAEPVPVAMREVEVEVGPGGAVAWFRATLQADGSEATPEVRITGVYRRYEGAWQLVQAHISTPLTTLPSNPEEPAADSAAAG